MSWFEKAETRLKEEFPGVKGKYEVVMKSAVRDALLQFSQQDEEFAQAVAEGGSFKDCMAAVAKGVTNSLSDIEAYRRAAQFYFDGAKVQFEMRIQLTPAQVEDAPKGIVIDLTDFF